MVRIRRRPRVATTGGRSTFVGTNALTRVLVGRPLLTAGGTVLGLLLALAFRAPSVDPSARLPDQYRLADLIERQQKSATALRQDVEELRADVERLRADAASRSDAGPRESDLDAVGTVAGLVAVRGPGLRVTLDDSGLEESPTDNVNDLVVHSQDVQAVVNALWRAGAEAIAINGQRLVGTSAVLCVGNTLLLNGTVHSPPYAISAIGPARDRFEADRLVRRLRADAARFGLRFSVERTGDLAVPAFEGATSFRYARPVE